MLRLGSLFSGVGGFELGFEAAGFRTAWQVEIDPVASSVLARRWPGVPRWGDIRDVDPADLPPVDVITFGSPCQDFSVAGRRAGLAGERSGLFDEAIRIIRAARPGVAVWENVPGALSSNAGRDFARVLDSLGQCGAVAIGWRVLDARYWGVPQRRRRIFLVASFGDGPDPEQVLFEPEGGGRHLATGREAGQDVAACLGSGTERAGWPVDLDRMTFVPATAHTLTAPSKGITWRGDGGDKIVPSVAMALNTRSHRPDGESQTFAVMTAQGGSNGLGVSESVAHTLNTWNDQAVATFDPRNVTSKANRTGRGFGSPSNTLHAEGMSVLSLARRGRGDSSDLEWRDDGTYNALRSGDGGSSRQSLIGAPEGDGYAVRRLMPVECERLMGWPEGWTALDADGNEISDSARYRLVGNGVVAPVAAWIARRLFAEMGG